MKTLILAVVVMMIGCSTSSEKKQDEVVKVKDHYINTCSKGVKTVVRISIPSTDPKKAEQYGREVCSVAYDDSFFVAKPEIACLQGILLGVGMIEGEKTLSRLLYNLDVLLMFGEKTPCPDSELKILKQEIGQKLGTLKRKT